MDTEEDHPLFAKALGAVDTGDVSGLRSLLKQAPEVGVRADLPISAGSGRLDLVQSFFGPSRELFPDADEIWQRRRRRYTNGNS